LLSGTKIVEFEGLGPAPFAGRFLAELGADVLVIKNFNQREKSLKNSLLNAGKKSVFLDLKNSGDHAIASELIKNSDALIEGFRPGVMERLKLGPKDLKKDNKQLVYGRMTGWGQTGPRSKQAGHDLNYIGLSGALHYASQAGDIPQTIPTLVGDIGGGSLYLVIGILSGLFKAQKTGKGTVVDAAIVDGSAHMLNLLMSMQDTGSIGMKRGLSLLDGSHLSRCYKCSDQKYISVQCLEPKFYNQFLETLSLDGNPLMETQFDSSKWHAQTEFLSNIFKGKTQSYWIDLFSGLDACVAPILTPEEAENEVHIKSREIWVRENGYLMASAAPRFDDKRPKELQSEIIINKKDVISSWT
jgi:crotonobetainyl-CoA:carnitine CoA-transferase CaiB-like acyl-CoA transferase